MKNSYKIAFAFGLVFSTAVSPAFSQETPKADATTTVLKPKPATTAATPAPAASLPSAPAMAASIASTPPSVGAATIAPAATTSTADIRLPAPKLALPQTPPPVPAAMAKVDPAPAAAKSTATAAADAKPATGKVVLTATVGAKPADPDAKPADPAAKPVKKAAAPAAKKPAKEEVKTAEAEPAKPKPFSLFRKKPQEEAVPVDLKAESGSVVARTQPKFFFGLFDAPKPEVEQLSEEQVQYDQKLASIPEKKKFKVKEEFIPVTVPFKGYKPGTIVIDTQKKYLYFVESPGTAVRYGVAVGREGLLFTGKATVGAKQPWPRWIPTKEMIERDPKKYGKYADGMDGGPDNPLGARAIYLYQGKQDTYLRIHGTTQPQSIGTASSNGCFRMINEHVIDLYKRVQMGAEVVVL